LGSITVPFSLTFHARRLKKKIHFGSLSFTFLSYSSRNSFCNQRARKPRSSVLVMPLLFLDHCAFGLRNHSGRTFCAPSGALPLPCG
jgi:hypothetical protein